MRIRGSQRVIETEIKLKKYLQKLGKPGIYLFLRQSGKRRGVWGNTVPPAINLIETRPQMPENKDSESAPTCRE
jgi:hypothetical protein